MITNKQFVYFPYMKGLYACFGVLRDCFATLHSFSAADNSTFNILDYCQSG